MLVTKPYDRQRALAYAERWAFLRNPLFNDYTGIGGNCTNFVSQCLLAGGCVMNDTPVFGWYYISDSDRAPAWTGVEFLYNFLTSNQGVGPFGREVGADALVAGDIVQLGAQDRGYYHTLLVTQATEMGYLVAAQSDNAFDRPLNTYTYEYARYLHIDGIREEVPDGEDCFTALYDGISLPIPPQNTERAT